MYSRNNRHLGWQSQDGGKDYASSCAAKVVTCPTKCNHADDFDRLTAAIVLQRHREGTLDERVVEALLLGVGFPR